MASEPLILADPALLMPPDRRLWTTPLDVDQKRRWPMYSPAMTAQCFFCRSTSWLRKWMSAGANVSTEFGIVEPPRTPTNAMSFRLWDIERLAYAFHENKVIDTVQLLRIILLIKTQAQLHGFIA